METRQTYTHPDMLDCLAHLYCTKDAFFVLGLIGAERDDDMKKIECIIRSERLNDLTDALKKIGIGGMTVSEVRGFGTQNQRPDNFLFVHKTKIEIYAADSQVKDIISTALMYCSTGQFGDGKIVVLPMDDCVRISSGERKNSAVLVSKKRNKELGLGVILAIAGLLNLCPGPVYATPTTHVWAPSTDIQPYKKIHVTDDFYFPTSKRDAAGNRVYVGQVYGLTFSLLPSDADKNPLDKIMAETGFDYKKGFGSFLDTYPWYFHFKIGVPEGAYFKNMPAFALGGYDFGTEHDKTNFNVWYLKGASTLYIGKLNLGRLSAGYFNGNPRLLRDKNGRRDNHGLMLAWERTMAEISDKLWLCLDYQGTQSGYGALNLGFSWKFTDHVTALVGYDIYNNPNARNTITFQVDIDI